MSELVEFWEKPAAREIVMLAGWHQWADAGYVSSGLPAYLIQSTKARQIGELRSDRYYLFQIPGTHDLVRPIVKFDAGYPEALVTPRNEIFYTGDEQRGLLIFLGDEPHLDIEGYTRAFLHIAQSLGVKRIIGFGGVYGELPYNKERMISCTYSLPGLKQQVENLAVSLSDYHGGASIGSYICKRAGEQGIEYISFYAIVPTYDFSHIEEIGNTIRIEKDFTAWLGILRRVNYLMKTSIDLADLQQRSQKLIEVLDEKVIELDQAAPQSGIKDYFNRLAENFHEEPFAPEDDFWEEELRKLFDKFDPESE